MRGDTPHCYPYTVGEAVKTSVGNTTIPIAIFRNTTTIPNLRALMQHLEILAYNPSADTPICIQLVGGVEEVGGAYVDIVGSELDVNTTATGFTGGQVALTLYTYSSASHGNTPASSSVSDVEASRLGLSLFTGQKFAIVASTLNTGATIDLAWAVNWIEKD